MPNELLLVGSSADYSSSTSGAIISIGVGEIFGTAKYRQLSPILIGHSYEWGLSQIGNIIYFTGESSVLYGLSVDKSTGQMQSVYSRVIPSVTYPDSGTYYSDTNYPVFDNRSLFLSIAPYSHMDSGFSQGILTLTKAGGSTTIVEESGGSLLKLPFSHMSNPLAVKNNFLYVSNPHYNNSLQVYSINTISGSIISSSGQTFENINNSDLIKPHPTRNFIVGICNRERYCPESVYSFSVSPQDGSPSHVPNQTAGGELDSVFEFSSDGKFIYVLSQFDSAIKQYSFDLTTGLVTLVGSTYLPNKKLSTIAVSPSGKTLFVAASDSKELFGYKVDNATGSLSRMPNASISLDLPTPYIANLHFLK